MRIALFTVAIVAIGTDALADKLAGNVLVWVDAPLYLDASTAGPSIRLAKLDHGRDQDVGHVVPMRVVSSSGDLVEVEPTDGIECAWWRVVRPSSLASLRLFVQRSDLAPVLTKPFSATFKNGSSVALQPGVAVVANKVAFHAAVAPLAVPAGSIGLAYQPHPIATITKPTKRTALLDEHTDVTLGDATFPLGPWVASTAAKRGDRMLFPIATRCMTATVSAPADRVHLNVSLNNNVGAGDAAATPLKLSGDRYYLKARTKLTSETGDHVVATLATDADVKKPTGAKACGEFVISREEVVADAPHLPDAARPARTLRLCAPANAVVVERAP
jgi:hypothetical protein